MQRVPQDVVFPISTRYWSDWTVVQAVSELVANAFDEQRRFDFGWEDNPGRLVIEDQAAGLGPEALLLGFSDKDSTQIGTWGEGLKAASMVLAREGIPMRVETAGFAFQPYITREHALGVTARRGGAIDVLGMRFAPSSRRRGTRIEIGCDREVEWQVRGRFLRFDPKYRAPKHPGRVIFDGISGRIYVGGVLVEEHLPLAFSYDFNLEAAKRLQNRDRRVIESSGRDDLINRCLREVMETQRLVQMVRAIIEDRAGEAEARWTSYMSDALKAKMPGVRRRLFGQRMIAVSSTQNAQANLVAQEQGYELLGEAGRFGDALRSALVEMKLPTTLDVAKGLVGKEGLLSTRWVSPQRLSREERQNLEWAVDALERVYGPGCMGTVRVYDATKLAGADANLGWGGYYDVATDVTAYHRKNLSSRPRLLRLALHELGHRMARHMGGDFADRTRGFEHVLGNLAGAAIERLVEADALPAFTRTPRGKLLSAVKEMVVKKAGESGIVTAEALAEQAGVTPITAMDFFLENRAPSIGPGLEKICERLGLRPDPVVLAVLAATKLLDSVEVARTTVATHEDTVSFSLPMDFLEQLRTIESRGDRGAEIASSIREVMRRPTVELEDEVFLGPFWAALDEECRRALHLDANSPAWRRRLGKVVGRGGHGETVPERGQLALEI